MIAIIPNENIARVDFKLLRQISNLSISEIKQASSGHIVGELARIRYCSDEVYKLPLPEIEKDIKIH